MIAHGPTDERPRSHLLGWGEMGPWIMDVECSICGAPPMTGHKVVMLGVVETLRVLYDTVSSEPRMFVVPEES